VKHLQRLRECMVTGISLKGKCMAIKGTIQENKEKRTREKTGERDKRRKQREIREQVERAP